jgi:hypothetical protein
VPWEFSKLAGIVAHSGEMVARQPAMRLIDPSRGCGAGRIIVGRSLKPYVYYEGGVVAGHLARVWIASDMMAAAMGRRPATVVPCR